LATCRKPEDVERLISEGFESFVLDYSNETSVAEGAQQALTLTDGKLDALFNNGAFASPGAVEDLPRGAFREIFETNVFGQFQLISALLPAMRANGGGRIVNNSSILGFIAQPFRGENSAHKDTYVSTWKPRLYDGTGAPDKWELPASAVSDKLLAALTAKNPHPRYFVTKPTYIMNVLRRILSTRLMDKVLSSV